MTHINDHKPSIHVIEKEKNRAKSTASIIDTRSLQMNIFAHKNSKKAREYFAKNFDEPALFIMSQEGILPTRSGLAQHIKETYPFARRIAYCSLPESSFEEWVDTKLIHGYIKKSASPDRFADSVNSQLEIYLGNQKLNSIREAYLEYDPNLVIADVDGKPCTPKKIFDEVLHGTELGREYLASWTEIAL